MNLVAAKGKDLNLETVRMTFFMIRLKLKVISVGNILIYASTQSRFLWYRVYQELCNACRKYVIKIVRLKATMDLSR